MGAKADNWGVGTAVVGWGDGGRYWGVGAAGVGLRGQGQISGSRGGVRRQREGGLGDKDQGTGEILKHWVGLGVQSRGKESIRVQGEVWGSSHGTGQVCGAGGHGQYWGSTSFEGAGWEWKGLGLQTVMMVLGCGGLSRFGEAGCGMSSIGEAGGSQGRLGVQGAV